MRAHISAGEPSPTPPASRDYDQIRRAIAFLSEAWEEQPSLERLAGHLGLSPAHTQKIFTRWCGLSPKEFVQAVTIDRARELLVQSASVLKQRTRSGSRAAAGCTISSSRTRR